MKPKRIGMVYISNTHKMALRMAIKDAEKRKDFIVAGELDDILKKSEGKKDEK